MASSQSDRPTPSRTLRLWPGAVAAALLTLVYTVPFVRPDAGGISIFAGLAGALLVMVWWLFFSRAPWGERLGVLLVLAAAFAASSRFVHPSIANGMMGMMPVILGVPLFCLALAAAVVAGRRLSPGARRASIVAAFLAAAGLMTMVRTEGMTGEGTSDFHWRWTETPEERLLAAGADVAAPVVRRETPAPSTDTAPFESPATPSAGDAASGDARSAAPAPTATEAAEPREPAATTGETTPAAEPREAAPPPEPAPEWPGFRGPERDGVIRGVRVATDWSASPPVEVWRRPIGPGWSSFAVAGTLMYTQEQRGDDEVVSAYNLTTGEPVWRHADRARFWESNGGPGPRATPTLAGGRVYTLGATGILNALDAGDGSVVWSRNAVADTGRKIPDWGIASSPLVVGDVLIAATAGSLAAYDAATGRPRWVGSAEGWGYSSPHLTTLDGVTQVVLLNGAGAIGVAPSDGAVLWKHEWRSDGIVQPVVVAGSDVLIGSGSGLGVEDGVRRIAVRHEGGGWKVEERWTSRGLKPYFNDFVVHEGHAFGFDGSILSCIDLEKGERQWKGGRYGHGQLVLLPDQDLLLVLSEEGELALVGATADGFTEVARYRVLDGKTWNHPVLVGDLVLARNGEEMVAFRLALAGR